MHDPYRMIIINIICSAILIGGIVLYRFLFPKKKINLFYLLILISFLPLTSLLRPGDYESGDFNIHIYRIISFYQSLSEGNIMPSWAADLNATYGNPLFLFNYPLPYYLVSFFHFIGFSFVSSLKILLGGTFFLSGIFMYIAMRKIVKNDLAAFTTAIFYLFNPYHLSDMHFRATPGESTLFMLMPLLLYFVTSFLQEKKLIYFISISLSTILLSLAHPMISLLIHGIIILFSITLQGIKKRIKSITYIFLALVIGLLASLYVWVPFIVFAKVMYPDPASSMNFSPFYEYFYSPYMFGFLFQGHHGELPFPIGHPQLFVVFLGLVLLLKTSFLKKLRFQYSLWFIILFLSIFFTHPLSNIIWRYFSVLWLLGTRLPFPMAISTSMIAGYLALYFSQKKIFTKIVYIFLFLTIFSTILNWGHRRVIPTIGDQQLKTNVWKSTSDFGLVWFLRTKWEDKEYIVKLPKKHIEIIKGEGTTEEIFRDTTKHLYIINAITPVTIKENTLWYPGWKLISNYKLLPIYPGEKGIINAKLPPGLQLIELSYEDIPIMKTLKYLGLTITIILFLALAVSFFHQPKNILKK